VEFLESSNLVVQIGPNLLNGFGDQFKGFFSGSRHFPFGGKAQDEYIEPLWCLVSSIVPPHYSNESSIHMCVNFGIHRRLDVSRLFLYLNICFTYAFTFVIAIVLAIIYHAITLLPLFFSIKFLCTHSRFI
jgi:hypothetical protein